MEPHWNPKKPGETVQYPFYWPDIYPDTIESFTLTVTAGTVTIANSDNDPRIVYAWVAGGADGETASVKCEIVTEGGQTLDRTATLLISSTGDALNPGSTLTKGAIIDRSFEDLARANYVFDVTAEERISALARLDSLASEWQSKLEDFGYIQPAVQGASDPEDAAGINAADVSAFSSNLALEIAGSFGKTPSPFLLKRASETRSTLFCRYAREVEIPLSDKMPVGAGNRFWFRNRFPPTA